MWLSMYSIREMSIDSAFKTKWGLTDNDTTAENATNLWDYFDMFVFS